MAVTPFRQRCEVLTIKVIETVANALVIGPRIGPALAFGRIAIVRLRAEIQMKHIVESAEPVFALVLLPIAGLTTGCDHLRTRWFGRDFMPLAPRFDDRR
jgi:hypothetical protein